MMVCNATRRPDAGGFVSVALQAVMVCNLFQLHQPVYCVSVVPQTGVVCNETEKEIILL